MNKSLPSFKGKHEKAQPSSSILAVCLPDVPPEPFQLVLTYIYTDRIDPTEKDREQGSNQIVLLMMEVWTSLKVFIFRFRLGFS